MTDQSPHPGPTDDGLGWLPRFDGTDSDDRRVLYGSLLVGAVMFSTLLGIGPLGGWLAGVKAPSFIPAVRTPTVQSGSAPTPRRDRENDTVAIVPATPEPAPKPVVAATEPASSEPVSTEAPTTEAPVTQPIPTEPATPASAPTQAATSDGAATQTSLAPTPSTDLGELEFQAPAQVSTP